MRNAALPAVLAAALVVPAASAAMSGICASVRTAGGYTLVDLYATFGDPQDRLQGIVLQTLNTSASGGFVQGASPALKGWAPDPSFTSTRDSLDSFFTIGESTYDDPSGQSYANLSIFPGVFPSGAWTGSPFTPPSNSIAAELNCGWFAHSSDPNNGALDISGLQGRINVQGSGATSRYGTWFAHLVIAGTGPATVNIGQWNANYFRPIGTIGQYSPLALDSSFTVPAPGALAVLAAAGIARRGRNR